MSKLDSNINPEEAKELVATWQRCMPEDLPKLFFAYNDKKDKQKQMQTERVVSYCLRPPGIKRLLALAEKVRKKHKEIRLVIHLGLSKKYKDVYAPSNPHFRLMIEVIGAKQKRGTFKNCVKLNWFPNPSFPTDPREASRSDIDAIPGASAFLFVYSWLETPFNDLGIPFEATPYLLGQRVKNYVFSPAESKCMLNKLQGKECTDANEEIGKQVSNEARLMIHLGRGISVSTHPYDFRPVIEITKVNATDKLIRSTDDTSEDYEASYYDFSLPEPPPLDPPDQ